MQRVSMSMIALVFFLSTGCAGAATTQPAASQPTTDSTSGPTKLKLSDAVVASTLEQGDWETDLQSQIVFKDRTLLFGQLATYGEDDRATATVPIVAFKDGPVLKALMIDDARLKNAGWSYVAAGPAREEFWAVLDASLDDKQPELLIVHSTDGGETFALRAFTKPQSAAVFDSFCMDANGHGRLSMYIYKDQAKRRRAGYYHLRTKDAGNTWSAPEHEPDAMQPAEDAPEDPGQLPTQKAQADDGVTKSIRVNA